MKKRRGGLGKGLDFLLDTKAKQVVPTAPVEEAAVEVKELPQPTLPLNNEFKKIPVDLVMRSAYQPRHHFDQEALEGLAQSIQSQGLIQPIVVRRLPSGKYELIAGERRWRASQLAGLSEIPAVIKEFTDQEVMASALIENVQREDLNPIEEALALNRLLQEFSVTQQELADVVGKSRSHIANILRLLNLNEEVKRMLKEGELEMGHARALLSLAIEKQAEVARTVVKSQLSVRETEALVKRLLSPAAKKSRPNLDPDVRRLQDSLSSRLGSKVIIQHTPKGKGQLVINYNSLDELEGILAHIH